MDKPTVTSNYLVVSTLQPYYSKVVPSYRKDFVRGWEEVKLCLNLIADCVTKGYKFDEWI